MKSLGAGLLRGGLLLALSMLAAVFPAAAAVVPACVAGPGVSPGVVGPVPALPAGDASRDYPWAATDVNLPARGYREHEFFFCGTTALGAYTSRMIVRRPESPAAFNGVVVVEWLNATANSDADLLWLRSHEHLMRSGYAYVGVSAQRNSLYGKPNGLKHWSPARYAALSFPLGDLGTDPSPLDPAAYAVFSQALRALRTPGNVNPLGDLAMQTLIVTGSSQSVLALNNYYNQRQPVDRLADGFLPFGMSLTSIVTTLDPSLELHVGLPVLSAVVRTPYLIVNTESDPSFLRLPDSRWFRLWEVAGTSHVDQDHFEANRPLRLRDAGTDLAAGDAACTRTPRSRVPLKYALNAALDRLVAWVRSGTPPPSMPVFRYGLLGVLSRDADGNVLGGIRLPQHAVPVAVNRRENAGSTLCSLYGQHEPFTAARLRALYPTQAAYVQQVAVAAAAAQAQGVLQPADAQATLQAAQAAAVPPP